MKFLFLLISVLGLIFLTGAEFVPTNYVATLPDLTFNTFSTGPSLIDSHDNAIFSQCVSSFMFYGFYIEAPMIKWPVDECVYTHHGEDPVPHPHCGYSNGYQNYGIYHCSGNYYRVPINFGINEGNLPGYLVEPVIVESSSAVILFSTPRDGFKCCVYMTRRRHSGCYPGITHSCIMFGTFGDCMFDFNSNMLSYYSCIDEDIPFEVNTITNMTDKPLTTIDVEVPHMTPEQPGSPKEANLTAKCCVYMTRLHHSGCYPDITHSCVMFGTFDNCRDDFNRDDLSSYSCIDENDPFNFDVIANITDLTHADFDILTGYDLNSDNSTDAPNSAASLMSTLCFLLVLAFISLNC